MDFGALAPEINSGRMYMGAGSGPMLAAAAAWDDLAAELQSAAALYNSAVESLTTGPWTGPSSMAMAAAAVPYVAWINATGAQAELAATQAKLAAGAYETAFAATVPPPVIAANRALLAALIATNVFGQNTAAIASTEAQYAEMWAQDAGAMYAYAGASAAAAQLTPFTEPPQTTTIAAVPMQAAAVSQAGAASGSGVGTQLSQLINSLPTALQSLANGILASPTTGSANLLQGLALPQLASFTLPAGLQADLANWNTIWSTLTGPYSLQGWTAIPGGPFLSFGQIYAWGQNGQGVAAYLAGPKGISGALEPLTHGASAAKPMLGSALGAEPAVGSMGKAALVGSMSVPQGWTEAAPAIRTLASALPTNMAAAPVTAFAGEEGVFSQMALSSLLGRGVAGAATYSGTGAAAGSLGGVVAAADPAAATIIVIPALDE